MTYDLCRKTSSVRPSSLTAVLFSKFEGLHPSWEPFGESYFEVKLPKEMRSFVLGGTRDLGDSARWFSAAKWFDALPLKLYSDPIVTIATAP